MAKVKFVNTAKYRGVWYPAHTCFSVDDKDVESLVKLGAIVIEAPKQEQTPEDDSKPFDTMKVNELKAYAGQHNIDISGLERKADILAAIKAAERE